MGPLLLSQSPQMAYDVAKEYKEHVDSIKRDRQLEQYLQATWKFGYLFWQLPSKTSALAVATLGRAC